MLCPQMLAGIKMVPLPVLPVFAFPLLQALGGFAVQPWVQLRSTARVPSGHA